MNLKTWIPLILAVALGLVAAYMVKDGLKKRENAPIAPGMTGVVVVKDSIGPGQELKADDLKIARMVNESVPDQAFTDIKALTGRITELPISKGQAIVETMLAPKGAGQGLQAIVPPGMRAITIEVNEFSGLAGLVTPGSQVDLISTLHNPKRKELMARTIVEDIKVTAVGHRLTVTNAKGEPEPVRSVTLLVTPEQAELIQLAASSGRPWLSLRSRLDDELIESPGVSLAMLRGQDDAEVDDAALAAAPTTKPVIQQVQLPGSVAPTKTPNAVPAPATQPVVQYHVVKIIQGDKESEKKFEIKEQPAEANSNRAVPPGPVSSGSDSSSD